VRYCPNIPCPHRQRVGSPAEFFDHVTRCSDCNTRLVASEEDAIEGLRADARDPYRGAASVRGEPVSTRRSFLPWGNMGRVGEIVQAVLLMLGGAVIALLAYGATGNRSVLYLVLLGPVIQRAIAGRRRESHDGGP
jgi:hypothetical protein